MIRLRNVSVARNLETRKQELELLNDPRTSTNDGVDNNFTMFEFNLAEVDVTLSFWRALEGGLKRRVLKRLGMKAPLISH